jgi:hypothetical protein
MTPELQREAAGVAAALADLELHNFACRLGLLAGSRRAISEELVRKAASCLDELSWESDEFASRLAVLIISMVWEHSTDDIRRAMRQRIIVCLTRLGLSPTTSMIDDGYARGEWY